MKIFCAICLVFLLFQVVLAAPGKKAATSFVDQMDSAVKRGAQLIQDGNTVAINDHSVLMKNIPASAKKIFAPGDPCIFTVNSTLLLWKRELQQFEKPSPLGDDIVKRAKEDYLENLQFCKKSLRALK